MCTKSQARNAGHDVCPELGSDSTLWSTDAPMAPPQWARDAFIPMRDAIRLADEGSIAESVELYQQNVPDRPLNERYDGHAQYAYNWRCSVRGVPAPKKLAKDDRLGHLGGPESAVPLEVFARDSYRCRNCNSPFDLTAGLRKYEKMVGADVFPLSHLRGNKPRAGASLVFRPVADHVEPWSRGGATDLDNLVTSCWPCNLGKMEYTVDELEITDPRSRPPANDGWGGLRSPVELF
jgi:5-methylcytosine-specific restriction endonuclease McrA